jgi:hypothetical protein
MPRGGLPTRHEMQHVLALVRHTLRNTRGARQLDLDAVEDRLACHGVDLLKQTCIEVVLTRQRRNAKQACAAHEEQWCHCLIEKPRVAVRSLLQDEAVSTRALRGGHLCGGAG